MSQIGPYRVLEELGRGGAGAVFKAAAPDGSLVAVKVLLDGRHATDRQRTRFQREARALSKVQHPSVVRLLDMGEEKGNPYLVTAFRPLGSLADALRTTDLTAERAARLGAQLANALAACHAAGILHRDLKPDNILIGEGFEPLLTDFGLSKDLQRIDETQHLTRTGAFLGTPGFWAPEQVAGKPDALGPASDVYGLGATLYSALTGRAPVVGRSMIEVVALTASQIPPPIHHLRPEIPRALSDVIMRCLEKAPEDRWPSALALEAALLANAQVPEPSARVPTWLVATPLLALAGLGTLAAVAMTSRPPERAARPSPSPGAPETAAGPTPLSSAKSSELRDLLAEAQRAFVAEQFPTATRLWRRAALQGDALAMSRLGQALSRGQGVAQDPVEAARWFRLAAEQGNLEAMTDLGLALLVGKGLARDFAEAHLWLRRAADRDHFRAQAEVGSSYLTGLGVDRDPAEAVRWLRKAAAGGNTDAMANLAGCNLEGVGLPKDQAKGLEWYRRAAERGHAGSMNGVGVAYLEGWGVASDPREAVAWFRKGVAAGDPRAMGNLGLCYLNAQGVEQDDQEAVRLFRRGAELGEPGSMNDLGKCLFNGWGVERNEALSDRWIQRAAEAGDLEGMATHGEGLLSRGENAAAASWFLRAAERGHARAMSNLGVCYAQGYGVPRDDEQAVKWFRRAADLGYPLAMQNIGSHLLRGAGVAMNEREAVSWYRRAAQLGHARAMASLGECLLDGTGVAKNEAEAERWLRLAIAEGDPGTQAAARQVLRRLGK